MVTLLPLDGSFIRYAGRFVDEAWGVAAGYNYFVAQAGFVCFELTIFKTVLGYVSVCPSRFPLCCTDANVRQWAPNINPAITISALLGAYVVLNVWSVAFFGESEFWLSLGKVGLIFMLTLYTFVTVRPCATFGWCYG